MFLLMGCECYQAHIINALYFLGSEEIYCGSLVKYAFPMKARSIKHAGVLMYTFSRNYVCSVIQLCPPELFHSLAFLKYNQMQIVSSFGLNYSSRDPNCEKRHTIP